MSYCSTCGKPLQPGASFCASCGAAAGGPPQQQQPTPMQGLAQAGLEVQAFNGALVVGRLIGLAVAGVILWVWVGPALADNPLGVIAAFFALAFAGLLAGQWVTLLLLRR